MKEREMEREREREKERKEREREREREREKEQGTLSVFLNLVSFAEKATSAESEREKERERGGLWPRKRAGTKEEVERGSRACSTMARNARSMSNAVNVSKPLIVLV
jgi:hypothetical protein